MRNGRNHQGDQHHQFRPGQKGAIGNNQGGRKANLQQGKKGEHGIIPSKSQKKKENVPRCRGGAYHVLRREVRNCQKVGETSESSAEATEGSKTRKELSIPLKKKTGRDHLACEGKSALPTRSSAGAKFEEKGIRGKALNQEQPRRGYSLPGGVEGRKLAGDRGRNRQGAASLKKRGPIRPKKSRQG